MFRVKLQVDPKVLGKYQTEVKTGVRGMGFVGPSPRRVDPRISR